MLKKLSPRTQAYTLGEFTDINTLVFMAIPWCLCALALFYLQSFQNKLLLKYCMNTKLTRIPRYKYC